MRLDPKSGTVDLLEMPTRVTYTREIEFDADGNIWTCNSNYPPRHVETGKGALIRIAMD